MNGLEEKRWYDGRYGLTMVDRWVVGKALEEHKKTHRGARWWLANRLTSRSRAKIGILRGMRASDWALGDHTAFPRL